MNVKDALRECAREKIAEMTVTGENPVLVMNVKEKERKIETATEIVTVTERETCGLHVPEEENVNNEVVPVDVSVCRCINHCMIVQLYREDSDDIL